MKPIEIFRNGAFSVVLVLGACESWPDERGGGAAEFAPPVELASQPSAVASWSDTLYLRLSLVEEELERFRIEGGMQRAPAALTLAEKLAVRVRRELAAGLEVDAAIDLLRLEERVSEFLANWQDPDQLESST